MPIWTVEFRESPDTLPVLIEVYAEERLAQEHARIERLSNTRDELWIVSQWVPKNELGLPDHMVNPTVMPCRCDWCVSKNAKG